MSLDYARGEIENLEGSLKSCETALLIRVKNPRRFFPGRRLNEEILTAGMALAKGYGQTKSLYVSLGFRSLG